MTLARKKTKEEAAAAKASGLRYLRLVHHAEEMAAMLRKLIRAVDEEVLAADDLNHPTIKAHADTAREASRLLYKIEGAK